MKILRYLTLTAIIIVSAQAMSLNAQNYRTPKMYMFGLVASFNDSIVHFTDIQEVENVWVHYKTKFLAGREHYSNQLRDYMTSQLQMPNRTCVVVYNKNRQKLEKEYLKMKRIYTTGKKKTKKNKEQMENHNDVRMISISEFKFQPVDMSDSTNE